MNGSGYPKGFYETQQSFDFFNYAGIDRSVHLYAILNTSIKDISLTTSYKNSTGIVNYDITYESKEKLESIKLLVEVYDQNDVLVKNQTSDLKGSVEIPKVQLWWPFTMNDVFGYQYNIKFSLINGNTLLDTYYQKTGIRTIKWTENQFLINEKPFYFRGFGKHEDLNVRKGLLKVLVNKQKSHLYQIRGKGLDIPLIVKDINLIKWLGANSFRTSHYPYSEGISYNSYYPFLSFN